MSLIKDKNGGVILTLSGNNVHVGDDSGTKTNILRISGSQILRGAAYNYGNRGVSVPSGCLATFQAYTAGSAPTDRLAVYRGASTDASARIGTMVRVSGGGKTAGDFYRGDSVDDAQLLGSDSTATDGGGASAICYLLLLQTSFASPKGYRQVVSNTVLSNDTF